MIKLNKNFKIKRCKEKLKMNKRWIYMIKEIIVVEGRDDVIVVKRVIDVEFIIIGGFGFLKGVMECIKVVNERCGVIIFIDLDFVGEKIRKKIVLEVLGCKYVFLLREEVKKDGDIGIENVIF